MRGKEKCKALKEIRRQIAEKNDIPYVVSQCTYQGECKGTCPKCEAELRYLERELAIRQGLGKAVAVVGISTSVCAGLTACGPVNNAPDSTWEQELEGDTVSTTVEVEGMLIAPPEESSGTETESGEMDTSMSEESRESRETDLENLAGAVPISEETEELIMGEILPPEELPEETVSELEGDIALPQDPENAVESRPPMEGGNS